MYYRKLQGGLVMMTFAGIILSMTIFIIGVIDCFITTQYNMPKDDKEQLSWIAGYNKKNSCNHT